MIPQPTIAIVNLLHDWAVDLALPTWAGVGFDHEQGRFEERLSLQGGRTRDVPLRLMVQARQLYVYALATQRGWHDGAKVLVEEAYTSMVRDYYRRDNRDGWSFAISRDGAIADGTRDLYAHAFVLLAVAAYVQATGKQAALAIADATLAFLNREFAAPQGIGYLEALPHRDAHRRQNPHMHLFEATLALWECSYDRRYLAWAEKLFALFRSRFFQRHAGVLVEYYDGALSPAPGIAGMIVEPGHHYEWCWLLRRYERATGRRETGEFIEALLRHADTYGVDSEGLVVDEILMDGGRKSHSRRLWPMTEAIKCNLVEGRLDKAAALANLLHSRFLKPAFPGTWIDRLDADGRPSSDFVPASSLYHLVGAIDELLRTTTGIDAD